MSRPDRFIRIETHDEDGTERLGEVLAETCSRPVFLALDGDLGSGKTRLARGLARGLGLDPNEISSPTFVIHVEHRGNDVSFSHLDAYRLKSDDELESVGFQELLTDADRLVAVEWASRIESSLPSERIDVRLNHRGQNLRGFTIFDRRSDDRARRRLEEALEARCGGRSVLIKQDLKCPTCGASVDDDAARPFCSPRCRLADLAHWFGGEYSISRPIELDDELMD
jgi:tRNA threonylcarbamoyladenosine biosynthesis protein TsaE